VEATDTRPVKVRCAFCLKLNKVDFRRAADRPRCGDCGRPILMDRPVKVTEEDFDTTVLGAAVPVLVDFYADWCGPCKMVAPVVDEIAQERVGEVMVAKVDTDRAPALSQRYGIRGIPTLILFRAGSEVDRSVGFDPQKIRQMGGVDS
jgi:thioredoxin 2